jgi:predicted transcriptional regulator
VISGSKVVGILKESPAKMASRLLGSEDFTAGDVMQVNPYVTQPEASLYEVLDQTPSNPYGCTVVQNRKGEVVGMFTPNELMKTVHRLVEEGR